MEGFHYSVAPEDAMQLQEIHKLIPGLNIINVSLILTFINNKKISYFLVQGVNMDHLVIPEELQI